MNESSKSILVFVILMLIVLIVYATYYYGKKQVILRALKKFNRRKISQFQSNELTKITGKVLHVHEPFTAPFSKRKCVAFIFKIEQKKSNGNSSHWKTIVKQENIQDFFLKQPGGEVVMVRAHKNPKRNYNIFMVEDKSISSGFMNDPTPEFEAVLNYYNVSSTNLLGLNKRLRYSERIIEVGERITVGGIANWKSFDLDSQEYNYSRIAVLESNQEQKLIITDHPQATNNQR